jgi:protein arginine kinase activator
MKCQRCDKQAAFHITDLTGESVSSVHLCPTCAKDYLEPQQVKKVESTSLISLLNKQLKVGQTAEQMAALDQKVCPICGISFFEFRKQGRLGCPHDYTFFTEELEPLIVNIHGDATHKGKTPTHSSLSSEAQTQLIQLRRQMNEAVEKEDYELATQIRDMIRNLESGRPV